MSNLINKTRLQKFAEGFWTKIKERYDDAFVNAELTATEKKIKFTKKKGGATVDVDLADYARLQDRNEFKQDVSVDDVSVIDTLKLGASNGDVNQGRVSGHRNITTKSFVDGYVNHMLVYTASTLTVGTSTSWEIWAVKKGATKEADRVFKKYTKTANVEEKDFNGTTEKYVKIEIGEKFENEVYFIVRCGNNRAIKVCNVNVENRGNVVNISSAPGGTDSPIDWGTNADNNIAIMYLYGRESIKSLAEKIRKTQADGSNYVLQSETTTTGGAGSANKVARLGGDGKLDKNMLPSIAINDYFSVTAFTNEQLRTLTYENGDVVVVENGGVVSKRYLCIHKGTTNSTDEFVELNSKDGVVQSVNGKVGAVELQLQATSDKVKLNITSAGSTATTEVDIISDTEITEILNALQ